jgi:hypothetical protein
MTGGFAEPFLRKRLVVAGILAACALLLTVAGAGAGSSALPETESAIRRAETGIAAALDSLLAQEGISSADVKTWRATADGKPTGRIEQRVTVGRSFLSISFNHALGLRVASFGARVVGSEKTREQVVTMHIVRGRATIRSIAFVTDAGR